MAQALGERGGGEQRVFALFQLGVVEVERSGEHIDGEGVGEGGFKIGGLRFFVGGVAVESAAAVFPGVLTGFSACVGFGLRPHEIGKAGGDADGFDKVVADVDEKFKGQRKAVLHDAGGDEDAVRAAELCVAMADGVFGEIDGVSGGDGGLVSVAESERHEVVGAAGEGVGNGRGHGLHDALEILRSDLGVSKVREAKAVGGLADGGLLGDFGGGKYRNVSGFWGGVGHQEVF